ncbi:MAG: TM2 domain-containing protein [Spirochaetaceae bacterium]|jgi:predicted transcriptional regulator|nr:TM2 domain-containing protein [Spirochaetaceae bacterium]
MYSVGIAYLLWFISGFGTLGFHRLYLGKIPSGIVWMLTGGLVGIGSLYDLFTLPSQVRTANANLLRGLEKVDVMYQYQQGMASQQTKNTVEHSILLEAKRNNGIITLTDLALAGNISLEEARKALDAMVAKGFAELRVRETGTLVYVIPEIRDSQAPLEDF